LADSALIARVDALPATPYSGEAFRHQPPGYNPLSGRGARIQGGRWNPPDSFPVLYLGLDRETVTNEFLRLARRSRRDPEDFLPRVLYRYDLDLTNVLDLRGPDALDAVGLWPSKITGDDLRPCQAVGDAARHADREGILAPSAAGPGVVLAVFIEDATVEARVHPERLEVWETFSRSDEPHD
jgi:RES domain-containing protein